MTGCFLRCLGLLFLFRMVAPLRVAAQGADRVSYVDPFIGTTKSRVATRWGSEGGVYPGAVAVSGFMQLTPETRWTDSRGYDYQDSLIQVFSCTHHNSGFPNGSSGRLYIMPVAEGGKPGGAAREFGSGVGGRPFSHREERAEPGYYRVQLADDGTVVEVVATVRAGVFRISFPAGVVPRVFVGDMGELTPVEGEATGRRWLAPERQAAFDLSEPCTERQVVEGGQVFSFAATPGARSILVKISASTVSAESARKNIDRECGASFDELRERARAQWEKSLSVAEVEDVSLTNKTIFYTALYHSLLVPWVISDVDGNYRGADRRVHRVAGGCEYGNFSPWDSYRSLHPLLSLLFPDKQSDMIRSLLDVYRQGGHLPVESMTGNHTIPIIVDAYRKGVSGIDKGLAYAAMLKSLVRGPFIEGDMAVYRRMGYIPFRYSESVTRTLEYSYDDWVLAQFAGKVMQDRQMYTLLEKGGRAYRSLFYPPDLLLLPRDGDVFRTRPGNAGYKEGDAWVYSYFVPQDPQGLIDMMGGDILFTARLDSALTQEKILFDNETVFQVPYLFNEAGYSSLTQQWVRKILGERYSVSPGGLPGNDDLGAISSWYVFSALGIFPVCPGDPTYAIGSPLFRKATLHLSNGKQLVIRSEHGAAENIYIRSLSVNHRPYRAASLPHSLLLRGGEIVFDMGPSAGLALAVGKRSRPVFSLSASSVLPEKVKPGELFKVYFSLRNKGSEGTMQVSVWVDGKELGHKNCRVAGGAGIRDSVACRLYRIGMVHLRIGPAGEDLTVEVVKPGYPMPDVPAVEALDMQPVVREVDTSQVHFTVINTGWEARSFLLPVRVDETVVAMDTIRLEPGERRSLSRALVVGGEGLHVISIGGRERKFKLYRGSLGACVLDLSMDKKDTGVTVTDRSGFGNGALVVHEVGAPAGKADSGLLLGKDCYLRIPGSPSLDEMGEELTMMLWVCPEGEGEDKEGGGLVDIFTKGDNHVLQVAGARSLTFFAGGWGRGDCTVDLPADWAHHWHHIAGVCGPDGLRVYIDGRLRGATLLGKSVNLSLDNNTWVIGRNEEFPGQRIYKGYVDKPKIFQAALRAGDILAIYTAERRDK